MSTINLHPVDIGIELSWFVRLGGFTSDQVMIQRFSTAKTLSHARRSFLISRILTVLVGVVGILLAYFVRELGTLFDVMSKVLGTFMGVMLGIFWLGMFTKRATMISAIMGAGVGWTAALFMGFCKPLAVGAIWIAPLALSITMILGVVFGTSQYTEGARRWNWFAIMRTELKE